MIKRSEKVAFLGVGTGDAMKYMRMTDFTELSTSKNAQEYTRKYVDEDKERTSVTGYAVSLSYKFDYDPSNEVHKALCEIIDKELTGEAAVVSIVQVDLSSPASEGGSDFNAVMRRFTVVPASEGDDANTYTYGGTFKVDGATVFGTATTADGWKTATFTAAE